MKRETNERRHLVLKLAAEQALALPLLESGYWFHKDLRDNFYFASHLFAYVAEGAPGWSEETRKAAAGLSVRMLRQVLTLQDQNQDSPMYGHWPLNLGADPAAAKPHVLPVELMGCLLILFHERMRHALPPELDSELQTALLHIYKSSVYRHPLASMHHHEAKHTALKLLLGHVFADEALLREGTACARRLLNHVRTFGFKEYGCLPWHWHWIQAFTCVREIVRDEQAHKVAEELLDYLWRLRAESYLRGAWVGPQSRIWPHDAPKDTNTPHDYIQFGDFPAPTAFPRLEGAALFSYEVSEAVREAAMNRQAPCELKRKIRFAGADETVESEAHTYAYLRNDYALGGIWERRDEFDNEQLRWDVSLPLDTETAAIGVNQLYFFHPGAYYTPGDDRHASSYGQVLLDKDTVIAAWDVPPDAEAADTLVGCLPKGEWHIEERSAYGKLGQVFVAVHLMQPLSVKEQNDRLSAASLLSNGRNAIVVEAIGAAEAEASSVLTLDDWRAFAGSPDKQPVFEDGDGALSAAYTTRRGHRLQLTVRGENVVQRTIDGAAIAFDDYTIF
ncbi:hypothetical protein YDYSG_20230 [Paenibacillus tyrfis]|uniref:hypothetical protein n=1 Tax=Paenibacillus tyrfis TaxID=1501230 RepID=UPI00248F5FDB|nr:hypothetical protein [Paenibacillus tyrfis]GLI05993.1 hypothetical protein YDYSG_20230 [Paenibacillus tyrfis]